MGEYGKDIPVWNVYVEQFNHRKVDIMNIFNHGLFMKECEGLYKVYSKNRENNLVPTEFYERLQKSLAYYFWSKCEYEVAIRSIFDTRSEETEIKVDAYMQVMNNYDIFVAYLWNWFTTKEEERKQRKRRKREKNDLS